MDFLTNLTSYFTDKDTRFLKKVLFVIFITLGLIIIDNVFSFSYYFNISRKTEQMTKINSLIQDETISKYDEAKLVHLRTELFDHKSLFEKDYIQIFSIPFKDGRNPWFHFVSVNVFLLLVMFILPLIILVEKDNDLDTILIMVFIVEPFLLLCCWVIATIFSKIPLLGNPWWNYGLNFISNLIFTGFVNVSLKKLNEMKLKKLSSR